MSGIEFHQTSRGGAFYDHHVPEIAKQLTTLARAAAEIARKLPEPPPTIEHHPPAVQEAIQAATSYLWLHGGEKSARTMAFEVLEALDPRIASLAADNAQVAYDTTHPEDAVDATDA